MTEFAELPRLQLASAEVIGKRLAGLQLDFQALAGKPALSEAEVHDIRVCIKKIRSWFALLKLSGSGTDNDQVEQALINVAQQLGPFRDLAVQIPLLEKICRRVVLVERDAVYTQISGDLQKVLEPGTPPAFPLLADAGSIRFTPEVAPADHARLGAGLAGSYQKVCDRLGRPSIGAGNPEALHRLRKKVKQLDYQLQLTCEEGDGGLIERHNLLKPLGSGLGNIHDQQQLLHNLKLLKPWETSRVLDTIIGFMVAEIAGQTRLMLEQARSVFMTGRTDFCSF